MSNEIVRDGDVNSSGGRAIAQQNSYYVDGKAVITEGSPVTPHAPYGKHSVARTGPGSGSFLIEGRRVNRVGDIDTCGCPRVQGSVNYIVG